MGKDERDKVDSEWFGLLPDAERAEVLKVQIVQREETRRAAIAADAQKHRDEVNNGGVYWVKALALTTLMIVFGYATCVGYRYVEVTAPASCVGNVQRSDAGHEAQPDAGGR